MKNVFTGSITAGLLLLVSSAALAADATAVTGTSWMLAYSLLGAGLSIGLAALGCGVGMGLAVNGTVLGTARNPELGGKLMVTMLIGLALIESLAIYALIISIILLFANPYSQVLMTFGGA